MKTKSVDIVGELESLHFDGLAEAAKLARLLEIQCRINRVAALALAEMRGRERSALLCRVLQLENPPKRKATKGGAKRR